MPSYWICPACGESCKTTLADGEEQTCPKCGVKP